MAETPRANVPTLRGFLGQLALRADSFAPSAARRISKLVGATTDPDTDVQNVVNAIRDELDMTRRVINVKAYGAKGDGVTDDTAAFTAAAAAGTDIEIPPGTYCISLWALNSNTTKNRSYRIRGAHGALYSANEKTVLKGIAANEIVRLGDTDTTAQSSSPMQCSIEDVVFDGNDVATVGLRITRGVNLTFKRCTATNCTSKGFFVDGTVACSAGGAADLNALTFESCYTTNCGSVAGDGGLVISAPSTVVGSFDNIRIIKQQSGTEDYCAIRLKGVPGVHVQTSVLQPTQYRTVTAATNASPIAVTTSAPHGMTTGDTVTISGVGGNTAANGTFTVTVTGSTTFTLGGSTGNGAYTSGGTVAIARNGIEVVDSEATFDSTYVECTGTTLVVTASIYGGSHVKLRGCSIGNTSVDSNSTVIFDGGYANAGGAGVGYGVERFSIGKVADSQLWGPPSLPGRPGAIWQRGHVHVDAYGVHWVCVVAGTGQAARFVPRHGRIIRPVLYSEMTNGSVLWWAQDDMLVRNVTFITGGAYAFTNSDATQSSSLTTYLTSTADDLIDAAQLTYARMTGGSPVVSQASLTASASKRMAGKQELFFVGSPANVQPADGNYIKHFVNHNPNGFTGGTGLLLLDVYPLRMV